MKNAKCSLLLCLTLFSSLTFSQEKEKPKKDIVGAGMIAAGSGAMGLIAWDQKNKMYVSGHMFEKVGMGGAVESITTSHIGEKLKRVQHISEVEFHYSQKVDGGWTKRVHKFQGNEKKILEELAEFEAKNASSKIGNIVNVNKIIWFEKIPSNLLNKAAKANAISAALASSVLAGLAVLKYNNGSLSDRFKPAHVNTSRSVVDKSPAEKKSKAPAGANHPGL